MTGRLWHAVSLAVAMTVLGVTAGMACARDGGAQPLGAAVNAALSPDDTSSLALLLRSVRGTNTVLCELAIRQVDMHGSWSHWGPMGGNPLTSDTTAAQLLDWIQRDHNDPAVVPTLRSAMRDQDACVRRVAGSFLGRIEAGSATAALLEALDDASAETRYVAAIGLGLSDKAAGTTPLIRRLRDDSPSVRRAAAWALGALEARAALEPLIQALERDADARVRQAAAWALGQIES
ncbi:MAG TPA: HEAT repeat domain-containing protein [Gemmatimonadaceae bacterium]|nr:HEAT repeat domain-containing protein [Gemmatimonadaceae bacterium]